MTETEMTEAHIKVGTVQVQACSACGSTAEHHLAYIRDHGLCVS